MRSAGLIVPSHVAGLDHGDDCLGHRLSRLSLPRPRIAADPSTCGQRRQDRRRRGPVKVIFDHAFGREANCRLILDEQDRLRPATG
jgi:hypothetical protein